MEDHSVFLQELQANNIVQRFDTGVEYELSQMTANLEISKYIHVSHYLTALTVNLYCPYIRTRFWVVGNDITRAYKTD